MIVDGANLKAMMHDGSVVKRWLHDGVEVWKLNTFEKTECKVTELVDITADISNYVVLGSNLSQSQYEKCVRSDGNGGAIKFTGSNGAQIVANCPCSVSLKYDYDLYAYDGAEGWYIWRAYAYLNNTSVKELFYMGNTFSGGGRAYSGTASGTFNLNTGDVLSIRIIGGGSNNGTPTGNRARFSGTILFTGTPT